MEKMNYCIHAFSNLNHWVDALVFCLPSRSESVASKCQAALEEWVVNELEGWQDCFNRLLADESCVIVPCEYDVTTDETTQTWDDFVDAMCLTLDSKEVFI